MPSESPEEGLPETSAHETGINKWLIALLVVSLVALVGFVWYGVYNTAKTKETEKKLAASQELVQKWEKYNASVSNKLEKVEAELAAEKVAREKAEADAVAKRVAPATELAKAATTTTIAVPTNGVAKTAEGSGTPVAKTTEDLTLEMFKSLLWREGASKEHGHILYPETPIVGDDFDERSTHFLAPLFLKYYRLEPVLKAKSGRKAWALVPIKNSLTPPKEILGMYKPK